MKISTAIVVILLALLSFGCGGDDVATDTGEPEPRSSTVSGGDGPRLPTVSDGDDPRFATVSGGEARGTEPEVDPPDQVPPQRLLIRDLEVGSGPVAHPGDQVAVRYLGVDYKTGEVRFYGWLYPPSLEFRLRAREAWEEGIWGMRKGGRRELVVPSRLAFGTGAIDYVIELVRLEPASKPPSGS